MALRKRGDIWHIDIKVEGVGRFRKSTRTSDRKMAKELHDRKLFEMQSRKFGLKHLLEKEVRNIRLSEFENLYVETRQYLSKTTTETDRHAFKQLINTIGDMHMRDITLDNLRIFKRALLTCSPCNGTGLDSNADKCPICKGRGGHSPTTYNIYRNHLAAAFESALNWGGDWGYMELNQFRNLKRVKVNERTRRALNMEEIKSLFKTILSDKNNADRKRFAFLIYFYIVLSLRRNEALNLTDENIDFTTGEISILNRKGKKDGKYILPADMIISLKKFHKKGKRLFPYTPDFVSKKFKKYAVKAGIKNVSLHSTRHTSATLALLKLNINSRVVQEYLGHADFKTTEGYITSDPERLSEPTTLLNILMRELAPDVE